MLDVPLLRDRDHWERVVDGRIDNTHADAFTHTVRVADPDMAIEVSVVALPSPSYEIREARGRALTGAVAPAVFAGLAKLAGVAMVGGLTRRVADATGGGAGATLVRDAVIEIARLARQAAKLPRERTELARGALACWELDTAGFVDLPDSCFTYSDAGRALFRTRPVIAQTETQPDLYSPRPGQTGVFERTKVARVDRVDGRVRLSHSMHDNVHGFDVTYEVDVATARIVDARSVNARLPYDTICSEPQRKIASLVGETLDAGLARRIQGLLGGPTGCAQLYDLTSDLLKLVR